MNRKNTAWSYGLLATASVALIAGVIVLDVPLLEPGMPLENRSDMPLIAEPQSINEMIVETVKSAESGINTDSFDRESALVNRKEARRKQKVSRIMKRV